MLDFEDCSRFSISLTVKTDCFPLKQHFLHKKSFFQNSMNFLNFFDIFQNIENLPLKTSYMCISFSTTYRILEVFHKVTVNISGFMISLINPVNMFFQKQIIFHKNCFFQHFFSVQDFFRILQKIEQFVKKKYNLYTSFSPKVQI